MQGLGSNSALFWASEKARERQAIPIFSAGYRWVSPRMLGLRSYSALFWAPEKAGRRHLILISPSRLALGTPQN